MDYYRLFFRRADAMKNNDTVAFDETSAELMKLATKLHPQSCVRICLDSLLLARNCICYW